MSARASPTARRLVAALAAPVAAWAALNALAAWRFTAARHHVVPAPPVPALVAWTLPGAPALRGWSTAAPATRAVVVFAHGVRNDRSLGLVLAEPLARRHMRLVTFDFRGHGESGGDRVTFGATERHDVARVLAHARREGLPVAWVGFSMGAVAYLLSGVEADAAVLDSPYAELDRGLRSCFGRRTVTLLALGEALLRIPLGAATRDIRPVDRAASLTRPTRFVFAERDHWVPPDAQARYRAAASARCEFVLLRGAPHGGHLTPAWAEDVAAYLDRALPTAAAAAGGGPPPAAPPPRR